jgi:hypothetical protein
MGAALQFDMQPFFPFGRRKKNNSKQDAKEKVI